jgi:UDP-glucose 4-epimerase
MEPNFMYDLPEYTVSDLRSLYQGRRVVVAGATGFLGLNCALGLRAAGAYVIGVARRGVQRAELACNELVKGDLGMPGVAENAVADASIVFDCLGYPELAPSDLEPRGNIDAEVRPHLNLFLACAKRDQSPVIVHVGTRLVYGVPRRVPVDEAHPVSPTCFYATHKLLVEQYLSVLARTHGLRSVIFRLSSCYGPNGPSEPGRLGVWNQFMRKAVLGQPLIIYGEGRQLRDFVYIEDVVQAFLLAAATNQCWGEVFNFGGEDAIALREAVSIIATAAGGAPIVHAPWPDTARAVETGDYRSDLTKFRQFIRFPSHTPFAEGVRRTIEAMRFGPAARAESQATSAVWGVPRKNDAESRKPTGSLAGRRVLVTGASGFLGSHLVRRFLDEGAVVTGLSRKPGRIRTLADAGVCALVSCDLALADATRRAVAEASPELVLHVASRPDGEETADEIRERIEINARGMLNLLEACRIEAPTAHIVYGDSRKVYGNTAPPHQSTTAPVPNSSYAISKAVGWYLSKLYEQLHGTVAVSVRPSLIYGPGQGMNVIQAVAEAAWRGESSIRLKGGRQTRDPLYIDDAVEAFVCAARRAETLAGSAVVIGGKEEISVAELARLVVEVCGGSATLVCDDDEARPTEIWRSSCDLTEADMLLGWRPRVGLKEGIDRIFRPVPSKLCVA